MLRARDDSLGHAHREKTCDVRWGEVLRFLCVRGVEIGMHACEKAKNSKLRVKYAPRPHGKTQTLEGGHGNVDG